MRQKTLKKLTGLYIPTISILLGILSWQAAVQAEIVPAFMLPAPFSIFSELIANPGLYGHHLLVTAKNAMSGYLIAVMLSLGLASLFTASSNFEKALYPYILTLKITPTIALTPLIILWLGIGDASKITIVVLICFFPIFLGALKGLKSIEPEVLDLFTSLGAKRWQSLWHLRLPSSLPYIFPGLKVALLLSLTGAIIGEYIASQAGIGYLSLYALRTYDTVTMFTAIACLVIYGFLLFGLLSYLERKIVFWRKDSSL